MNNGNAKRIAGFIVAIIMGVVGFKNAYDEQKREEEFEDIKSRLAKLEGNEESE